MFFRVENKNASTVLFKSRAILTALSYIRRRPIKPSEYELNNYLKDTYDVNLKELALLLFEKIKLQNGDTNELLFTFMDQNYDKLANIITYGNGRYQGSSILIEAFREIERKN